MATIQERVKQIRKMLKLNQSDFGAKIGIGQGAVTDIEREKVGLSARNFDAICSAFNVNPEWLRDGKGEMFRAITDSDWLKDLAARKGLTPAETAMIASLIELPPAARKAVIDWAFKLVEEVNRANAASEEDAKAERQRKLEARMDELQAQIEATAAELNKLGVKNPTVEAESGATG